MLDKKIGVCVYCIFQNNLCLPTCIKSLQQLLTNKFRTMAVYPEDGAGQVVPLMCP